MRAKAKRKAQTMHVKFYTLGCKVNQYETDEMAQALTRAGFCVTENDKDAQVFVVNSCSVTAESDRKTRQTVRRLKRNFPDSTVVLTGCMPQAFPEKARALDAADVVLGNRTNGCLLEALQAFLQTRTRQFHVVAHRAGEPFCGGPIAHVTGRTRANLKIEDGCDRFCAYCIIPYARGRVRSKPVDVIREESETLARAGYRELVLVGINLSAYGKDTGESFADAVAAAASPDAVARVRLGSLEPDHLTDELLLRLAKIQKLCGQFHISLQSGCTRTLERMNRHYTADEYAALCTALRQRFPGCTLTTDMMVGFPGETEADFLESVAFAQRIGFEKIHVFPYSVRPGTRAAAFPGQLGKAEKERRAAVLLETAKRLRDRFFASQVGKTVEVLCEQKARDGACFGYTANYTPVRFTGGAAKPGDLVSVRLDGVGADCCEGEAR